MTTNLNVGVIECGVPGKLFQTPSLSRNTELTVRKVYTRINSSEENVKAMFPQAELVNDTQSIFQDNGIELVIFFNPATADMHIVGEAIHAGKHVRIDD
jgi:predicted dehydrogenase